MTGFLARLVRRAQGRATIAKPLVPPRFAPGLARRASSEIEESEPIEPAGRHVDDDTASRTHHAADRAPLLAGHTREPTALEADPTPFAPHRAHTPHGFDDASAEPLAPRRNPPESERPRTPPIARAPEEVVAPLLRPRIDAAPLAPPVDRSAPTMPSLRAPSPVHAPAPATASSPRLVSARRTLDVPPLSANPRTPARSTRAIEPAPSSPVVQIRIGRVEVRAVAPPVVPTRTPSPRTSSAISLDEYLRRRDGR